MKTLEFNKKVAKRIYDNLKVGQSKVVVMEEFAGSNQDFIEAAKMIGLEIVSNGYTVEVRK